MALDVNKSRSKIKTLSKANYDFQADVFKSGLPAYKDTAEAVKQITEIPGATDFLQDNPDVAVQVLKDPAAALDAYTKAQGGTSGAASGAPQAQITVDDPVVTPEFKDPKAFGLDLPDPETYSEMDTLFTDALKNVNSLADSVVKANEAYLKGELPGDVVAEIRRNTAETALKSGAGGDSQAAANLTARDLGTTSVQLQQQGIANTQVAAELYKVTASLAESRREFDKTYALNVNTFLDSVRKTDLTGVALEQDRLMFNAKQNLAIVGYIGELATARADIAYKMAAADIDPSGATAGFDQIIAQLDMLLVGAQ